MTLPAALGRLRRIDRIGAGGFATVWLYHDDELDSDVAVKALADNWASRTDVRERFVEEAKILRRADSDHVVRVYDIGETDGTPYFVMTYADLGTIASLLDEGHIPLTETVGYVEQAAAGLQVLHATGVIHRDIKPQNLLLRSTGGDTPRLLVADLGMAKAMLHASGLTQVVGTPAYMAPEQATGIGLSPRADLYGLGAVAYRMITGRAVRDGGISELLESRAPLAPSELVDVPPGLDGVLMRALAPEPEDRWPDVTTFARALRGTLEERPGGRVAEPVRVAAIGRTARMDTPTERVPRAAEPPVHRIAPEPAREAPRAQPRGTSAWVWVFALLVLAATFAAAYAVTTRLG